MIELLKSLGVNITDQERVKYTLTTNGMSDGFMDLSVEKIPKGKWLKIVVGHIIKQSNGQLVDPEISYLIDTEDGKTTPVLFKSDMPPVFKLASTLNNDVLESDKELVKEFKEFSRTWANNIKAQGYKLIKIESETEVTAN